MNSNTGKIVEIIKDGNLSKEDIAEILETLWDQYNEHFEAAGFVAIDEPDYDPPDG